MSPFRTGPGKGGLKRWRGARVALSAGVLAWACLVPVAARGVERDEADVMGDVTLLPALNVSADRIDDFGFRVSASYDARRSRGFRRVYTPVVDVLLPNTPASRAGLRPGDRIVSSDRQPTASGTFSIRKWRRIQEEKWASVAAGANSATWTLEVEDPRGTLRTLHLRVPTPAPRWGGETWAAPDERSPAVVREPGPLAERAREVLDHGIWVILRQSYVRGLELGSHANTPYFLAHQWTLSHGGVGHRMYVSQERGRTDIVLEVIVNEASAKLSSHAPNAAPVSTMASPTTVFANRLRGRWKRRGRWAAGRNRKYRWSRLGRNSIARWISG
jgi:hypothetical protein